MNTSGLKTPDGPPMRATSGRETTLTQGTSIRPRPAERPSYARSWSKLANSCNTEEYQAATEEMKAANNELLPMNEELRSKNEKLETSKEALRRERNFIDRVLDTVGTLVVVVDLDGRIVRVNSECAAVSGYSEKELEGTNVFDLIPSEEHDGVRTVIARHKEGVEQVFHENHWVTKDGDGRLIRWSSTVLLDDDGNVQNIIGAGIDITERRKLERRLVTVADAEQRRIGLELHDMLASHLAGTAMIAEGLADELAAGRDVSPDRMQEVADLVREASEQTRLLSHSLMPLDMRADSLADGLERLAERTKKRSDVRCALDADDSVPDVKPDVASHLYRIAAEAVRNAVTHATPDTIRIRLELDDDHLVLTVRDDGPGIAKEIDTSDGFGIQMMRYRAELVGAVLSIRPTKKGGTVVTCRVPGSALSLADDGSSEGT